MEPRTKSMVMNTSCGWSLGTHLYDLVFLRPRKLCSLPDAMSNTNTGASSLYEENPDWEKYRYVHTYIHVRVSYRGRGAPGFPPPQKLYVIMMLCNGFEDVIKVYFFQIRSFNHNAHY